MRRRIEMKQLREVWRSCTRDNVEADESYFVLNPAADWLPMEIKEYQNNVRWFWSFVDEASWAVDHSLDLIKANLRRASTSQAFLSPSIQHKCLELQSTSAHFNFFFAVHKWHHFMCVKPFMSCLTLSLKQFWCFLVLQCWSMLYCPALAMAKSVLQ